MFLKVCLKILIAKPERCPSSLSEFQVGQLSFVYPGTNCTGREAEIFGCLIYSEESSELS